MKKIVFVLFLFKGVSGYAQDVHIDGPPPAYKRAVNPNAPKFAFKQGDTFDFGNIPEGPAAEHVFEFTNAGKEPLIIQNVGASCGCTTPTWSKDPILPGRKGKVTVRFTTTGRANTPFNKEVYISSNAVTEKERYELRIKGFVVRSDDDDVKTK